MRTISISSVSHRLALGVMALMAGITLAATAHAQPVTTDSRIKTFVYNPNEVFAITTHYGYQSNIEFGPKEEIDTISVGDRVAWQIIPTGRRLFIRALEENARTNMTIVTNFRAYQFDLRSSTADAVFGSEELTYVVRFFYPTQTLTDKETPTNAALAHNYMPVMNALAHPSPVVMPAPAVVPAGPPTSTVIPPAAPVTVTPAPPPMPVTRAALPAPAARTGTMPPPPLPSTIPAPMQRSAMNYRYTYSGPGDIAPTKIYDDGKTTYFKLRPDQNPDIAILTAHGDSMPISARRTTDGLLAIDAIAPRFRLNQAGRQVIVYNEAGGEVF